MEEQKRYVVENVDNLTREAKMALLRKCSSRGMKIIENADGSRINIDVLPDHDIEFLYKFTFHNIELELLNIDPL